MFNLSYSYLFLIDSYTSIKKFVTTTLRGFQFQKKNLKFTLFIRLNFFFSTSQYKLLLFSFLIKEEDNYHYYNYLIWILVSLLDLLYVYAPVSIVLYLRVLHYWYILFILNNFMKFLFLNAWLWIHFTWFKHLTLIMHALYSLKKSYAILLFYCIFMPFSISFNLSIPYYLGILIVY